MLSLSPSTRRWLLVIVVLMFPPGCLEPVEFVCASDDACGAGGRCENTEYCSFSDEECISGRRYGDHAGSLSQQCVGSEPTAGETPSSDTTTTGSEPGTATTTTTATTSSDPGSTSTTGADPSTGSDSTTSSVDDTAGSTSDAGTTGDGSGSTGSELGGGTSSDEPGGSTGGEQDGPTGGSSTLPPPTCTEVYGSLFTAFEVCTEDSAVCRFSALTQRQSCDNLCALAGGTCLHAWDNVEGMACVIDSQAQDDCSLGFAQQICECTLPEQ